MNAMFDFKHAIDANPENALAHYNAANLYFNMRQFEKAIRHYDYAVYANPEDEGMFTSTPHVPQLSPICPSHVPLYTCSNVSYPYLVC